MHFCDVMLFSTN